MGSVPPLEMTRELINLQLGWPSPRLFAREGLLQGAEAVLSSEKESASALVYGPHIGHPPLRQSLAWWLTSIYSPVAGPVSSDGICITNGASGNLSNVLQRFTDPLYTRRVFMVEPTYFLACPIFEDNGLQGKLRGVPEDSQGLDIEFLRRELAAAEAAAAASSKETGRPDRPFVKTGTPYPKIYKFIIYCVPTFANPSGKTFPIKTREALVAVAREFDALIVSDDVYDVLHWPSEAQADHLPSTEESTAPPRLVDIDRSMPGYDEKWGNTLSNGSFSKIVGPGVRVGWADCAPALAHELSETGSSSSGGAPSHLTSTFVDKMLRGDHLQTFIRDTLIPTYRARYHVLMTAIDTHLLPLGVTVEAVTPTDATASVAGGFFTYLRLPADLPIAKTVAAVALKDFSLRIAFGHMFTVTGDAGSIERALAPGGFAMCIRLCWAWHEEEIIREGVERLSATIQNIRGRMKKGEDFSGDVAIGIR